MLALGGCGRRVEVVRVAAASDLQFALTEVAAQFATDTGDRVELVFGSSGTLTRQTLDGAPFAIFFSADEAFVERLVQGGHTQGDGALYAIGRLVLFAPPESPMVPAEDLAGLARLIETKRVSRFAIANPEHAPYGRGAEQALRARGIWDAVQLSLVLGDNVSQAAQFAAGGDTVGGIIAYSLVLAPARSRRPRADSRRRTRAAPTTHGAAQECGSHRRAVLRVRAGSGGTGDVGEVRVLAPD